MATNYFTKGLLKVLLKVLGDRPYSMQSWLHIAVTHLVLCDQFYFHGRTLKLIVCKVIKFIKCNNEYLNVFGGGVVIGIYILISLKDGNKYIGSSNDVKRRLAEHENGNVKSTKYRRPLELFAVQECESLHEARKLERIYKKSHGCLDRAIKNGGMKIVGD